MFNSYKLKRIFNEHRASKNFLQNRESFIRSVSEHVAKSSCSNTLLHREKKFLSQYGEGGLIASLLSEFGTPHGATLELGFSIFENNSIASLLSSNRKGFYIDGSSAEVAKSNAIIRKAELSDRIFTIQSFITKSNINDTIESFGMSEEIDYLSIDIDGNDYWIWQAIEVIHPRIVSVEYNASFGPTASVSTPYRDDFIRHNFHKSGLGHGASFRALISLGADKGYLCLGPDSTGLNLYFLRSDIKSDLRSDSSGEVVFRPHVERLARGIYQIDQELIAKSLPIVEV